MRSEIKPSKQQFLDSQFGKECVLVSDMKDLQQGTIWDQHSNSTMLMPRIRSLDSGVPCTSRTPQSSQRSNNVNCVQEGRAATGTTAQWILEIVDAHDVDQVTLECVVQLAQVAPDCTIDDATYICNRLNEKGFWCTCLTMDARDYGSTFPRERLWWEGLKRVVGDHDLITQYFMKMLTAFKMNSDTYDFCQFITIEKELRRQEAKTLGHPFLGDAPVRPPSHVKSDPDYKFEHYKLFSKFGLAWPVSFDAIEQDFPTICFAGMFPRQCECAILLATIWPMPEHVNYECLDINPSFKHMFGNVVDFEMLESTNDAKAAVKGNPWSPNGFTLTGSTKLCIRTRSPSGDICVRLAEGMEYFRLIGWCDALWAHNTLTADVYEFNDLLANMAGNAWCVFHYAPFVMASMSTFGKFLPVTVDLELPNIPIEVLESSDSSSESAATDDSTAQSRWSL